MAMNDWNEFQRFLFEEGRLAKILIVAGVILILCVVGTAF